MGVEITAGLLAAGGIEQSLRKPRIGYENLLFERPVSSFSATSSAPGYPADAVSRPDTAERWRGESSSDTLTINLGATRSFNYIGIAAHTLGSEGASVTVQGEQITPADNRPILLLMEDRSDYQINLNISGGPASIGVVYVGRVLEVMRPVYGGHTPGALSRETTLKRSLSRGGQFLGQQIRRKGTSSGLDLANLSPEWYRDRFDPFVEHARRFPFFLAWRPTRFPDEVMYAWAPDDIKPSNSGTRDLMEVSFSVRGMDE